MQEMVAGGDSIWKLLYKEGKRFSFWKKRGEKEKIR